ncbi:1-deoxy-D-xylulose-5-phosphate reductoisomerase [Thermosipho atlanticus]|uniref:1-deoxy-D-xylulose 5-phosphate reductoisomerase n=1 Tax=Thermosipho atlanticus DSM 15807 TaxID=1123380 RepID=A0A1M5SGN9_9BACT|nr:1-deoxy-D-xylulose-5-phosphate reductoisomerase [Thermosipho atlanticus]SHH37063.1 1-deoxy-D-xylulose 5-phosphate reductoisomerase [Thermosipho atlanticus DSM 15807]
MEKKSIVILGATGSIGTQTLEVIRNLDDFYIGGIVFGKNINLARALIKEYKIENYFSPFFPNYKFSSLDEFLEKTKPDIVVSAIPGFDGMIATLKSIKYTKRLALATKESLVCAGPFVKKECKNYNTELIPIDSEHSAIFQLYDNFVEKIIITASGGAVRDKKISKLEKLSPKDILKHPVWNMGKRITVDSSTMVNKAFEVIEAYELFGTKNIDVYIHPTGTVHGAVLLKDGTIKIHFGYPDMKIPIAYSLTHPERKYSNPNWPKFDNKNFIFQEVDKEKYPAFFYGKSIMENLAKRIAFNAADEIAVERFLKDEIKFTKISEIIIETCEKIDGKVNSIEDIIEIDKLARDFASNYKV